MTRPEPSLVPYINPSSITNLGEGRVYGLPLSRSNKPELHWSHIIHAEIASVIATMRENDNWSFSNAIDYRRPYSPELQQQQQQQLQQLQELQHNQQQHQQQPLSNTRDEIMNLTLRSATQHYNYGANLVSMSKGVGLDPVLEYNSAHSDSYFFAQV